MSYSNNNILTSASVDNCEGGSKIYINTEPERSYYEKNGVNKFVKFHNSLLSFKNNGTKTEACSPRLDKFGNPIVKNKKSHKISFADQFPNEGKKLSQVNKVASFKRFNADQEDTERYCFTCVII